MKFDTLQRRVQRAERLLEGREQQVLENWANVKGSWRQGWTPWRIVSAGLIAGFVTGRAEPLAVLNGPRILQMIGSVSALFAQAQDAVGLGETPPPAAEEAAAAATAPRPAEAATELSEHA